MDYCHYLKVHHSDCPFQKLGSKWLRLQQVAFITKFRGWGLALSCLAFLSFHLSKRERVFSGLRDSLWGFRPKFGKALLPNSSRHKWALAGPACREIA